MLKEHTLVELCAGSAAVSLRWLRVGAKPPIPYQGSKRAYADSILRTMGLCPGGHRAGRVVLVEAGPWGEAWAHWATGGIPDTTERLQEIAREDPRELWTRLRDEPLPADPAARVARWAVLQLWSHGGRDTERAPCFGATDAYGRHAVSGVRGQVYPVTITRLIERLHDLPDLAQVEVHHADVHAVDPIPGARVYIDPDYQDTIGYGHTLPREDVLAVAARWYAAGCVVAVSEALPLPLHGWHSTQPVVGGGGKGGVSRKKQQREWITFSPAAATAHTQGSCP